MSGFERAQDAHRAAFAMITAALTDPTSVDIERMISDHMLDSADPGRALIDLAHALVWHASGALLTHAGTTTEALKLVQNGAIAQEMKGNSDDDPR